MKRITWQRRHPATLPRREQKDIEIVQDFGLICHPLAATVPPLEQPSDFLGHCHSSKVVEIFKCPIVLFPPNLYATGKIIRQ
ncbi:hypothetical protein HUJ04_010570 [Dendroctonus ponderosae]|nr:hypothetical protein HUJ04_010570 [Dendroctonus ponderosae]